LVASNVKEMVEGSSGSESGEGGEGEVGGAGDGAGQFASAVVQSNLDDLVSHLFTEDTTEGGLTTVDADSALVGGENTAGLVAPAAWEGATPDALGRGKSGPPVDGSAGVSEFVPVDDDWFKEVDVVLPTMPPVVKESTLSDGDGQGYAGGGAAAVQVGGSNSGDSLFGAAGPTATNSSDANGASPGLQSAADSTAAHTAQAAVDRGWSTDVAAADEADYTSDTSSYCSGVNQFLTVWVIPGSQGYGCAEAVSVAAKTFDECSDYCTATLGKHHTTTASCLSAA
jgi:hypothetical protein